MSEQIRQHRQHLRDSVETIAHRLGCGLRDCRGIIALAIAIGGCIVNPPPADVGRGGAFSAA